MTRADPNIRKGFHVTNSLANIPSSRQTRGGSKDEEKSVESEQETGNLRDSEQESLGQSKASTW